jgi:hypothetical protein
MFYEHGICFLDVGRMYKLPFLIFFMINVNFMSKSITYNYFDFL